LKPWYCNQLPVEHNSSNNQQPKTPRSSQQVKPAKKPEDDELHKKLKLRLEESKRQQKLIEADVFIDTWVAAEKFTG